MRAEYASRLARAITEAGEKLNGLKTVYFGGGSPALCDLGSVLDALAPRLADDVEFTVELNPLDVTKELLTLLSSSGVNRISMGVQSLDDAILRHMARGYSFTDAERAFYLVKEYFDNAGIDLIVGYPGETAALLPRHARLQKWGLRHCSVYSLIREERTLLDRLCREGKVELPDDDTVMNRLSVVSAFLADIGLTRYEVSNYAVSGFECRHNMAVWRGEDYIGLGEGAHGRVGQLRTRNLMGFDFQNDGEVEEVSEQADRQERRIFALRTQEGLDVSRWDSPQREQVESTLDAFATKGLLRKSGAIYRLTPRGFEVCDSILAEIV